ncbi:MAG: DUF3108 domain-containing protein [Blastocatellia bacterium]|nr:DUF3108 domain-containing protein [Blastocatellia bacterium]
MRKTFSILLLALIQVVGVSYSQTTTEKVAHEKTTHKAPPKISKPLPFRFGETLTYEVSFSKLIFSGTIGEIKLTVSKTSEAAKPELIELKAEAVSKGFFPKLFGIKVNDRFNSLVNPADFGLHASTSNIEEGKRRREQKSMIDREAGRVTYIDRDLANQSAEPKIEKGASPRWVLDLLSACYFVRTQKLKEGDRISIPVSDGGKTYDIEVIVGKREEVKVEGRKFKAVRLDVKAFDGRYVRRSGEMFMWVTDDSLRLPVRAKIKSSGATVSIDLKEIKFN